MAPFQAKGDQAQWRSVYDELTGMRVGEVLTYEALAKLLDRDPKTDRSPVYRARRQLELERKRTLVQVPGVGYRIAQAVEHEDVARQHHRKGRRQITRAQQVIRAADRGLLTVEQARRFDALERQLGEQARAIRHLEARQRDTESVLAAVQGNHERLAKEHQRLIASLKRAGALPAGFGDEHQGEVVAGELESRK